MLRKEKMKGERGIDKFSGENSHLTAGNHHHYYNQQLMFENGVSSSSSYASGFCFPDAASSSVSSFDHCRHPTPKTHFVDQFFVGSNLPDSYYRMANNGVMVDELGLTREFQKMDIGSRVSEVSSDTRQFHRDPDLSGMGDYNVAEIMPSIDENFGVLEGFMNGFSGNGGFPSSVYRDEKSVKDERNFRLGLRGVSNLGNSLGSNYSYAVHGQQNCSINFPLEGTTLQGDECYENGVSLHRGNRFYDRMPVYESNGFSGNGSVPRAVAGEYISNGGAIPREYVGYGNELPIQVESAYGPHTGQYMMDGCKDVLSSWGSSQNLSMYEHSLNNEAAFLEQYARQCSGNVGGLNSMDSSQIIFPSQAVGRGNTLMREKTRAVEQWEGASPVALMNRTRHIEPYGCLSRIIPEKGPNGVVSKSYQIADRTKKLLSDNPLQNLGDRNIELSFPLQSERSCENGGCTIDYDPLFMPTSFNSVSDVQGSIFLMAKDQHGCRLLQKKFDDGSFEDVKLIFNEVIDHVVELMVNQFGNYLIQKLLNVCNEEQKMKIVHMVTKNRGELVKISLNSYGTRVVQKLIESLETRKQISLVIKALEPGFLHLMTDLNGNHVVQRCLQCLSNEDNKFIFDAAAMHCVEIATHRHGCCVLQRCIDHSTGEYWLKLIDRICSNALVLAQDPFGNYVVQYVIEMNIPSMRAKLISQFEGNFVLLSTQKFSSHVVEKCLKCIDETHPRIVRELLSVPHFDQLVQDPFANYVLQSALEQTKGTIYESLVAALRPHSILRTNPYCKKIFSRGLLKK